MPQGSMRLRDEFVFDTIAEPAKNEREESLALVRIIAHSLNIFLLLAYAVCYNVGLMTLYRLAIITHFFDIRRQERQKVLEREHSERRRSLEHSLREALRPLRELILIIVYLRNARNPLRDEDKISTASAAKMVSGRLAHMLWRLVITLLNIIAPILAVWALVSCVEYFTSITYGLSVEYRGEHIGNVRSEAQFDEAERRMRERLINAQETSLSETIPRFTLKKIPEYMFTDVDVMTDRLINLLDQEVFDGYGLYVDNAFRGALDEGTCQWLLSELDGRLSASDMPGTPTGFNRSIKVQKALYPATAKTSRQWVENLFGSSASAARSYEVQSGDTPLAIANKNGIEYSELLRLNPEIETRLNPGDILTVAGDASFLRVVSTANEKAYEPVEFTTNRVTDNDEYIGYFKIVNDGQMGEQEILFDVTYLDGERVSRKEVGRSVIKEPINQLIIVGGKKPSAALKQQNDIVQSLNNEMFMWPVDGGYVYMPIWGYRGHTGNDISGIPSGTPIRASASGTVTYSGYTAGGYGRHIKIDHGNGIQTLYAHNSANYVRVGERVIQGQKIGGIGSTGNSTGNHCHFEIIINGQHIDARKYIGTRSPR